MDQVREIEVFIEINFIFMLFHSCGQSVRWNGCLAKKTKNNIYIYTFMRLAKKKTHMHASGRYGRWDASL